MSKSIWTVLSYPIFITFFFCIWHNVAERSDFPHLRRNCKVTPAQNKNRAVQYVVLFSTYQRQLEVRRQVNTVSKSQGMLDAQTLSSCCFFCHLSCFSNIIAIFRTLWVYLLSVTENRFRVHVGMEKYSPPPPKKGMFQTT